MTEFIDLQSITFGEALLRVGFSMLFGAIIGFERYTKNKPIDFRAYMLVAISTCMLGIMTAEIILDYNDINNGVRFDIAKVLAGTLTGIGFLGAGAIIKIEDKKVIGTATGASIWASGSMGLCLGFGYYGLAALATVAILITLLIGGFYRETFEDKDDTVDVSED